MEPQPLIAQQHSYSDNSKAELVISHHKPAPSNQSDAGNDELVIGIRQMYVRKILNSDGNWMVLGDFTTSDRGNWAGRGRESTSEELISLLDARESEYISETSFKGQNNLKQEHFSADSSPIISQSEKNSTEITSSCQSRLPLSPSTSYRERSQDCCHGDLKELTMVSIIPEDNEEVVECITIDTPRTFSYAGHS